MDSCLEALRADDTLSMDVDMALFHLQIAETKLFTTRRGLE